MTDYNVDRLSTDKIEEFARNFLANCPKLPSGAIDILKSLRSPTVKTIHGPKVLRLTLVADDLLPDNFAQMWAGDGRVTVTARTSLWNQAEASDPNALKELRHEFGHVLLHSGARTKSAVPLDRKLGGNAVHKFIEPDCSAEKQADCIAACLAMPLGKISPPMDVRDVSADWNVPLEEAQWRLERVRLIAPKRISRALERNIDSLRTGLSITEQACALWDQLPCAPDSSPALARMARGFMIERNQYNRYTQTGWTVEAGKIVPLMLKMQG